MLTVLYFSLKHSFCVGEFCALRYWRDYCYVSKTSTQVLELNSPHVIELT